MLSYAGVRLRQTVPLALIGGLAGIVAFAVVGYEAVVIGNWWLHSVPTDTNRTAAMLTALLCPPATLAALLCCGGSIGSPDIARRGLAAQYLAIGVVFSIFLGSLIGSQAAAITWAISCQPVHNCFPLTSVIGDGAVDGAAVGIPVGLALGLVAFRVRFQSLSRS